MTIYRYNFPTKILSGIDAVTAIGDALKDAGLARPLLVTDRDLAHLPPVHRVSSVLSLSGLAGAVYSGVYGNPTTSQVANGVDAYRAHKADSIVAVGGGAALDVAKAIALMVQHPGELADYEDDMPGARPIDQPIPFWISVPTTAGTGSEVGRSTVISAEVTRVKKIYFSPRLLAPLAVLDPTLSVSLPPKVTAATGLDALTHLVEAFLAKGVQPMCDGIALQGLKLVAENLPAAVAFAARATSGEQTVLNDLAHLEARGAMLNAAMMGGVAFQKGLGVTHSMAHALGAVCDMHHGLANGILVPFCMAFNLPGREAKFIELGRAVGIAAQQGSEFVSWLKAFCAQLGVPKSLNEAGVRREQIPELVRSALQDGCHRSNPRDVTDAHMLELFEAAWRGA